MNIIWLCNVLFPEPCRMLGLPEPVLGGWMYAGARELLKTAPDIRLAVVTLYSGQEFQCLKGEFITYYLVPSPADQRTYRKDLLPFFRKIRDQYRPDIVHIHGSEYPYSLAWVRACGAVDTVVSVQGLVSVYAKYYLGGISEREVRRSLTFRDLLRRDTLLDQQRNMELRGMYERELFASVSHTIGRTEWDRSHVWAMNPAAQYHILFPTLREPFYKMEWKEETCERKTIFLSQSHYPIKGFHKVVEALPLILRHHPETRVLVTGDDMLSAPAWRRNGYARYLARLMERLQVRDRFTWLGRMTAEQMAKQYAKAHVFICPSSIENESNSLAEGQLVGTPCIASYTGGMMDSIEDGESGFLYRFEETEMLARRVCELFDDMGICRRISSKGRQAAQARHDRLANAVQLECIYSKIAGESAEQIKTKE